MSDNDRELRIGINTEYDSAPAAEAGRDIKKVSEGVKESGHSFIHAESQGKAFHKLLHAVSHESPILGEALRLALNPVSGMIIGAVLALEYFKKKNEEAVKKAEEAGAAVAEAYTRARDEAAKLGDESAQSQEKFAASMAALAAAQDTAEAKLKKVVDAINLEKDALKELADIQGKSSSVKENIDLDAERNAAIARHIQVEEAKAKAGKLNEDRNNAAMVANDYDEAISKGTAALAKIDKELAELEKKKAVIDAKGPLAAMAFAIGHPGEEDKINRSLAAKRGERGELDESLNVDRRLDRARKAALERANKAALDNQAVIDADLSGVDASVRTHEAMQGMKDSGNIGVIISKGAEALVELRKHGGKIKDLSVEQVNAIKGMAGFLQALGLNNTTMIGMIEKSNGDLVKLWARVRAVESKVHSTNIP